MGFISKKVLETPPSATVSIADRVTEMRCQGVSVVDFSAGRAVENTPSSALKSIWKDWEKRCLYAASEINTIPKLSCDTPEGGFYAWIDISETGETSVEFGERLLEEQHVALIPGSAFGPSGEGFMRMTCVRSWDDLRTGLSQLKKSLT